MDGHSNWASNLHTEGLLKAGWDCDPDSGVNSQLLYSERMGEQRSHERRTWAAAQKCQLKSTSAFATDEYWKGTSLTPSWLNETASFNYFKSLIAFLSGWHDLPFLWYYLGTPDKVQEEDEIGWRAHVFIKIVDASWRTSSRKSDSIMTAKFKMLS